jgi:hypothetical protein
MAGFDPADPGSNPGGAIDENLGSGLSIFARIFPCEAIEKFQSEV